jgi:transposase
MRGEVLVGPERRRRWSEDEKARIIEEALQPGAQVADIGRRYNVSRSLIYAWRREARCVPAPPIVPPEPAFVPVLLSAPEDPQSAKTADQDGVLRRSSKRRTVNGGEIEVVLPGRARLTLRGRVEPTALRAVLAALKA